MGPGFDALAVAVDLPFELIVGGEQPEGFLIAEPTHPAAVAYRAAGGTRPLTWRSPIPPGRGLGFSGAARVAGAMAGVVESGLEDAAARRRAFEIATALEGHADNVAASVGGGVVATNGTAWLGVPLGIELDLVAWWPRTETSTAASRAALPEQVPLADAASNIGHASLLLAALVAGDLEVLAESFVDRLHQDVRLARTPASAEAMVAMTEAGAVGAWLSGSGPTVACFVTPERVDAVVAACPPDGTTRQLSVASSGVEATA